MNDCQARCEGLLKVGTEETSRMRSKKVHLPQKLRCEIKKCHVEFVRCL